MAWTTRTPLIIGLALGCAAVPPAFGARGGDRLAPPGSAWETWTTGGRDGFAGVAKRGVRLVREADGTLAARLADNEYRGDADTDLLLHFNPAPSADLPRWYRHYRIVRQGGVIDDMQPALGTGALRFFRPDQALVLRPLEDALLGETVDLGSFTVEFRLSPFSVFDGETVFARYGGIDEGGPKAGLRAVFRNERLAWEFRRFFRDRRGAFRDFTLAPGRPWSPGRWRHVAVSFDHYSGKLTAWIDGQEEHVAWATETGAYGGTPLVPAFPASLRHDVVLGGGYLGKIDELRVSRIARTDFGTARYAGDPGRLVSAVRDTGSSGTALRRIAWRGEFPAGSAVLVEARASDEVFAADDFELPWIRIANGGQVPDTMRGRYVQWRATLLGVERGGHTPCLSQLDVTWEKTPSILRPVGLVATAGDGRITLRWVGNTEPIDGYRIFVGTEKGEYLLPGSPVTVPLETVDRRRPEWVLYGLENDRLYYIAVAAYDSRGKGHLSAFSAEVHARPTFSGR